jgi:hypothetical protein
MGDSMQLELIVMVAEALKATQALRLETPMETITTI